MLEQSQEMLSSEAQDHSSDQSSRIIDVRGELEITIMKSLSAEKGDVYTQGQFIVNLFLDTTVKEGVIVLDVNKTRKLLKLLNLEGI
jgi:hypothetical protein